MSLKVMSAVWEMDGIDGTECLVMLALADHADDEGRCYPSIRRLADRSKLSERGVQKVIGRLIDKGFVSVVQCGGRRGANLYIVSTTPSVRSIHSVQDSPTRDVDAKLQWRVYKRDRYACRYCGFQGHEDGHDLTVDHIVPVSKGGSNAESNLNTCCVSCNSSKKDKDLDAWIEQRAMANHVHPEPRSPRTTFTTPLNHVRETPEPRSPEPSGTIIEPSEDIPARDPAAILCEIATPKAVKSFLGYRRKIRKPVSEVAAERIAKTLTSIANQGGSPDDALGMAEEKGWQSIKAEWYFKEVHNDQSPQQNRQSAADDRFGRIADAAIRNRAPSSADFGFR